MATLTDDAIRDYQIAEREDYPVVADDTIYEGAAVGEDASGYARPLVAGDIFLGFAVEKVDNAGGAAGDINVKVRSKGRVKISVDGVTDVTANDRAAVYASDDDTFTLTSASNSLIGYISRWDSGAICIVEFDALAAQAALQV